jgi:uncharacterized protein YbjT (DUF2867 family)
MTVLLVGATGTTGGALLRQLRGDQIPVRALTRSAERADRLRADGVEAVVGDCADPTSLPPALEGIDAVYVASPTSTEIGEHEGNLARAAAQAGVSLLVKLSVIGAAPDAPLTFGRLHAAGERAIEESGIAHTFLRPNGFMQNTLSWAQQIPSGTIRGPVMHAHWAILDVRDIAAVAARVLASPDEHAGRNYTLTGPEPSSPHEQVEIISEVLERPLETDEVTIEQAQEALRAAGVSAQHAEWLGELWRMYAAGQAAAVSPDVERLTGRAPYTYRQFAEDHHTAWLGPG